MSSLPDESGLIVQSRLRRQRVRAAVILVVAVGVAAATLILVGAIALATSAWFPAGACCRTSCCAVPRVFRVAMGEMNESRQDLADRRRPGKLLVFRVIGLAVVLGLGSTGWAGAQEPPPADPAWAAVVDDLDRSVVAGDAAGITRARDAVRRRLEDAPPRETQMRLRYLLAYANWRLLGANPARDDDERDALTDEAKSMLRANLDAHDDDAEALALLGAVYGMKIGSSIWRGMTLGRRASRACDEARAIDEGNPRFLLLKGMDVCHRPARFGGGLDRAERWFRSAVAFFAAQPPDALWPRWGRLDAHAWLGRTAARLGDPDAAREQYERVLAIEPDHAWVRDFMLPDLDR